MMKSLSLNAKIALLLLLSFTGSGIIAVVGLSKMASLEQDIDDLANRVAQRALIARHMATLAQNIRNTEKVLILEDTHEGRSKIVLRLQGLEKDLHTEMDRYFAIASEEGKKDIQRLREHFANWHRVDEEIQVHALADRTREAVALARGKSRDILIEFDGVLEGMVARNKKFMEEKTINAEQSVANARIALFAVLLGCIAIAGLVAALVLRSIKVSVGRVVTHLTNGSEQVKASAEQLSGAAQVLSSSSTEAAASLEETVSSLEELSSMVKTNADHCSQASSLSKEARGSAEAGSLEIKHLIQSVAEISQSSKKIEEIINVIDDIAFQTNLLALNAAVEAARAGEQGKGFAVVAEAVRNLAQRSAASAKDIASMIHENVSKCVKGTDLAQHSDEALNRITDQIRKVADLVAEINSASQEQANGIGQISKAMNDMDNATQQNAATAEETAASSEEMAAQAQVLGEAVHELQGIIFGARATAPRTKVPGAGGGIAKPARTLKLVETHSKQAA